MPDKRVELFPEGLALGLNGQKPAIIFKDKKTHSQTLPVPLTDLDPTLFFNKKGALEIANSGALKILKALGSKLEEVIFDDVTNGCLYVTAKIKCEDELLSVNMSAQEIVPLALVSGCRFLAQENVIEKSRRLHLDWLYMTAEAVSPGESPKELH